MPESTYEYLYEQLDTIWNAYGEDKVGKGSAFERLMASYLRTAPEYADRFDEVYLWQDWPERGNQHDHGIDIVARDIETGGWCAVQCKFYDPQHHVSKKDIDSFLAASAKNAFTSRIIFSTAKDWGPTAEKQLDGLTVPVVRIGVNDLLESKVDWSQINWQSPQQFLPTGGKHDLRPHQKKAKKAVLEGFSTHDRGQLIMACGTGKTFTSLRIAEQIATDNKARPTTVLFLVPSIQLVNQTLREWKQEGEIPFRAFAVCSDTKVGKNSEDIGVHDLIYPATTDTTALAAQLQERSEDDSFTVIFSTYQSIEVVAEAQRRGGPEFDLVICDEAHRTTGVTLADEDESAFVRVHDNSYVRATKRLYMTATPRLFNPDTKDKAKDADAVLASMDDESVYGPTFHRLGFGQAVEQGLLTDYKVLIFKVDQEQVAREFSSELAGTADLKLDDAAKLVGCWNGLSKRFTREDLALADEDLDPMRTAVAFAGSIKSSKAMAEVFPQIVDRLISSGDDDHPGNELAVDARHVDGTMNALDRGRDVQWLKAASEQADEPTCRVLSNVKCLSEGVDVPSLDAVLFLAPKASQVDIVQSVGRVMRRDPSGRKKVGYIILPVVVKQGESPEQALADNKRFQAVWQVLQALRAHDDRFNAMVNQLDLNTKKDTKVRIFDTTDPAPSLESQQLTLPFGLEDWRDAIYARIVKKVGERRYWETWAKDVATIAEQHIARITGLLADDQSHAAKEFDAFLHGLRANLNDGITRTDAVEMLAQHLITRPIFEALFAGYDFAAHNPVAQTMERMLAVLDEHSLDAENSDLENFYASVRSRVEGVDNAEGRQRIIIELYDKFFASAFKRTVDKLGIVYTPVEIVDFILNSADEILRQHFGQGLTDEGVHILDGFTGTGTFMTRLLQSGLIEPHDLARKYAGELHANEILLLAYYIAAVNIETTYQDLVRGSLDEQAAYEPFPGLVLTDTFQAYEQGDEDDLGVFPENNERINRQRSLPITVIVGNPPYSAGQKSANDNNANDKYEQLDAAIANSFTARSNGDSRFKQYDSYIRAIKWASLRIKERGVVAYITNGGWLDSNTADGMRLSLADEFDDIYILNLRGNSRAAGDLGRKEGGNVFDVRVGITVTILVKNPGLASKDSSHTPARIRYCDIGEYLSRDAKIAKIVSARRFSGLESTELVNPSPTGEWVNHRREDFTSFLAIGDIFTGFSLGVMTNRDAWLYGSSSRHLLEQMSGSREIYEKSVAVGAKNSDPTKIKWSARLEAHFENRRQSPAVGSGYIRKGAYRPFCSQKIYFDPFWIQQLSKTLTSAFPTAEARNQGFVVMAPRAEAMPAILATDVMPDFSFFTYTGQYFARWRYADVSPGGETLALHSGQEDDGSSNLHRFDNVTDESLQMFRSAYGESFTKDDIFHYLYGLLHSPEYRETYAADLRKSLPRIPFVHDAQPFVDAGSRLLELHLQYETVTPYPIEESVQAQPTDAFSFYAIDKKMRFGKATSAQKAAGERHDRSVILYNDHITLHDIPIQAYRYMIGSRSAIEWIMDRYQVRTDRASGIVNDPNDWSREVSDPRYIIDLLARIVTVSLETMQIVDNLPALQIRNQQ